MTDSLSGFRIMWIIVMYDLPVLSKEEKKSAIDFRNGLLDMGFTMSQFSVYLRSCSSQSKADRYIQRIPNILPPGGKINIILITDKQYERIMSFVGKKRKNEEKKNDQFDLF